MCNLWRLLTWGLMTTTQMPEPLGQSLPTRQCGWGLCGGSLVTKEAVTVTFFRWSIPPWIWWRGQNSGMKDWYSTHTNVAFKGLGFINSQKLLLHGDIISNTQKRGKGCQMYKPKFCNRLQMWPEEVCQLMQFRLATNPNLFDSWSFYICAYIRHVESSHFWFDALSVHCSLSMQSIRFLPTPVISINSLGSNEICVDKVSSSVCDTALRNPWLWMVLWWYYTRPSTGLCSVFFF